MKPVIILNHIIFHWIGLVAIVLHFAAANPAVGGWCDRHQGANGSKRYLLNPFDAKTSLVFVSGRHIVAV